jgi:transketolase
MTTISKRRVEELEAIANRVRGHIVRTVHVVGGGHIGGPLSATDMLVALYFELLKIDPDRPNWDDRDRFILSKGHSCIALYAVMAERGYFPLSELLTFDRIDSRLQGHPDMTKMPGIDMSSGSLGQGLSPGVGMALGAKLRGMDFKTYVMLGDGEIQEGQVWEAAFIASRYGLDNLIAILDYNKLQQYGWHTPTGILPPVEDPVGKWEAFGWDAREVDGHDIAAFIAAVQDAGQTKDRPSIVVAHTTKGKGVTFMEHEFSWHARVPTADELRLALCELGLTEEEAT